MRLVRLRAATSFAIGLCLFGFAAQSTGQTLDCARAVPAFQQIQTDLASESTAILASQMTPAAQNTAGSLVDAAAIARPLSSDDMRLMVRQSLERLAGSGKAVSDIVARASFSGVRISRSTSRTWGEQTRSFPSQTAHIASLSRSFSATPGGYQAIVNDVRDYQGLADSLLKFIDEHQGLVPANDPVPGTDASFDQLSALAAKVGLDADLVLTSASVAMGDLRDAELYRTDSVSRITTANARLASLRVFLSTACPNGAVGPAQNPPAARPAPAEPPTRDAGHHISGTKWAVIGGLVGAAGGGVAYAAESMGGGGGSDIDMCLGEKSAAVSAANNASATCVGASSAQIIACNQAGANLVTAVTNYCRCEGGSVAIPGNASYSTVISMINGGTACR